MSKHPDKGWMVAEKAAGICHNPRSSHGGSTVLTCLGKPALTIWTAVLIESSWMWLWGRGGGRTPFLLFLLYGRHCCEPWVYTVSSGSQKGAGSNVPSGSSVVPACMLSYSVMASSCNPMHCSPLCSSCMEFFRQEYWSGLPFPPPGDLPKPGIESTSPVFPYISLQFYIYIYSGGRQKIHKEKYDHLGYY